METGLSRLPPRAQAWAGRVVPRVLRMDWGYAIALALGLLAAGTFLTRPGLPRGTDAELHVFRAAELGYAMRGGAFYPRWAPNLFLGYGYPIFNYYAPLTYYLANLLVALLGIGIVAGVKTVFVLGLLIAALGSYALGRELFGRQAGVVAAASFTFAPYVVLIDPHARGDLAEHFAVCLLPVAIVAFRRVMSGAGGRCAVAGTVLSLATLVASHNLAGLMAAILLAGYWGWEVLVARRRARAVTGILVFALAAAISAFFWLPALLEWGAVELVVTGPGHFDFRNHFVSLGEILAPSPILDLGAAAPDYRFSLGLAQWALAVPAFVAMRRTWVRRRAGYFIISGVCLTGLMLRASLPLWEGVPGMAYVQFPWRLLGPANLALAVCAAAGTTLVPPCRWRGPVLAVGLAVILGTALPALYPPMWSEDFGSTEPVDIIAWEVGTGALGTTSTRDFVPKGAALVPMRPVESLVASYSSSDHVDKVNRATIPDGARVLVLEHGPLLDRFDVYAPETFVLRLYTFHFPGWRAYVDGVETEIEVARPEGFITIRVPAGAHEVLVRFEDTPARALGWSVSAVGGFGLLLSLALRWPSGSAWADPPNRAACDQRASFCEPADVALLGGVVLAFALLKGGVVDPNDGWMRYTSPLGQARPATHRVSAVFGDQIELIGYDLARETVPSGGEVEVALYWRALSTPSADYQSFVHLAHPLNLIWGQEDHLNPGDLPTTRWPLDKYVRDEYSFDVLPGTPPGEYALNIGLYSMAGGYRLTLVGEDGHSSDSTVLATVHVERPRRQPAPGDLAMTHVVDTEYANEGVTLVGYRQELRKVDKGQAWTLVLFWRADRDAPSVGQRDLILLDQDGQEVLRLSGVPGGYPGANWRAGDIVRDPVAVPPAADVSVEPGRYQLAISLVAGGEGDQATTGRPLVLGKVRVRDR